MTLLRNYASLFPEQSWRKYLVLVCLVSLTSATISVSGNMVQANLVNLIAYPDDLYWKILIFGWVPFLIIGLLSSYIFELALGKHSLNMQSLLRNRLFESQLHSKELVVAGHGESITAVTSSDIQRVQAYQESEFPGLVRMLFSLLFSSMAIASLNIWMFALSMFFAILLMMITFLSKRISVAAGATQEENRKSLEFVSIIISELTAFRVFAQSIRYLRHFYTCMDTWEHNAKRQIWMNVLVSLLTLGVHLLRQASIVLIAIGVLHIKLGDVLALILLSSLMGGVAGAIVQNIMSISSLATSVEEIRRMLNIPQETEQNTMVVSENLLWAVPLTLNGISYSYAKNKSVLHNISCSVQPGSMLAICGEIGCGKSTLLKLIAGLYRIQDGSMSLGEIQQAEDLFAWRKNVAYVDQQAQFFAGTIEENITAFADKVNSERLQNCIKQAQLADTIAAMPDGILTKVGAGGGTLSGGQRQRMAIARALYKEAPILALDEITSSLDKENTRAINKIIASLKGTRIIIRVEHVLENIEDTDRVLYLHNGLIQFDTSPDLLVKYISLGNH